MNLQEIRQKYPEYNDMSDADFTDGFHKKFYSDMSFEDFSSKIGYAAKSTSRVDQIPGIGSVGNQKPAPEASLLDKAIGVGEAGISTLTGLTGGTLAGTVGGLQGILNSATNGTFGTPEGVKQSGEKFHEQAAMATYEPRTKTGKEYSEKVGKFISEQAPALIGIMPQLEGLSALSKFKKVNESLKPKEPSAAAKAAAEFEAKKAAQDNTPVTGDYVPELPDTERMLSEAGYNKALEQPTPEQPLPFVPELYKEEAPRIPKVKNKFAPTLTEAEQLAAAREAELSKPLSFERTPVEPAIPDYVPQEAGLPFSVEGKLATPVELGTHAKSVQQGIRDIKEIAADVERMKAESVGKAEVGPEQQLAIQSLEHDLANATGRTAGNLGEVAQLGRDLAQLKIKTAEGTKTPLQVGPNRGKFGQGGAIDPDVFLKDFPNFVSSVIKDTAGKLKVLYHGTSADQIFDNFKANKRGIFLTEDPSVASMYAKDNDIKGPKYDTSTGKYVDKNTADRVIPVYVDIKNPYKLSEQEAKDFKYTSNYAKMQRDLTARVKAQGHDGILYPDGTIVAFDPKQIVSATSPKIGQSSFGKGQRGSIGFFGKDPFEKFAENLRKEVPNVSDEAIRYAWDKQQAGATEAISSQESATAQGSMDGLFQLTNTLTGGKFDPAFRKLLEFGGKDLSETTKAIHKYMADNDIARMSLSDTGASREGGFFKTVGNTAADALLSAPMNLFEGPTRSWAFSSYARQAVKDGHPIETALKIAHEQMDTMVNYNPEAGSMGLSNLGIVGQEARGLHTFMTNYYSQLYRYIDLAKNQKEAGPLMAYLALTFAAGGAVGFIGADLADWLLDGIKSAAHGKSWDTPDLQKLTIRKWLMENTPDAVSVGPLSAATGLGMYGSFTTKVIDPERSFLENTFPKTTATLQIGKGLLQTPKLLDPNLTEKEKGNIYEGIAPKFATQAIRNKYQNKDGTVYDPNADRAGLPMYQRTPSEQTISERGYGVRGLSEVMAQDDMLQYYKGSKNVSEASKAQMTRLDKLIVASIKSDGTFTTEQKARITEQANSLITTWGVSDTQLEQHLTKLAESYGLPTDALRKLVNKPTKSLKDATEIKDLSGVINRQRERQQRYGYGS